LAKTYARQYRKAFKRDPGVWGAFTYDSAKILFSAVAKGGTTAFAPLQRRLKRTKAYRGQTGSITIAPATGYRVRLPFLSILEVNAKRKFVISR
jgi:ABC-type branched-subunit amino acid transport system substrate-binding protein